MIQNIVVHRIAQLLLIVGPIATLAISPFSNYDPINLIKILFVSSLAFSVLGFLVYLNTETQSRIDVDLWIASVGFIIWMLVVMVTSGAPVNQQFWGMFGRNTGILTYFILIIVLLGTVFVQRIDFYNKLVIAIIITSIPVTGYALVQVSGNDPIAWSEMAPFATLGNINFSSAFFGLASLCATVLLFAKSIKIAVKVVMSLLIIINLTIILETESIQGIMIYFAGVGIAGYFYVRSNPKLRILRVPYLVASATILVLTVMAVLNQGPLAKFIFGNTILFRYDYWYAGWMMTLKNPIFGVGMDSYGDWYRELRGEVATGRTGPDRITNTAHNIYLDISSNGGFPLLLAYLAILFLAARAAFRVFKRTTEFDPYFVAIFSAWVAYLIQAAVSINQIGVGIWGWLFTGALIGFEKSTRNVKSGRVEVKSDKTRRSGQQETATIPAIAALIGIGSFVVGFLLAFFPFNADSNYKKASLSGSYEQIRSSVQAAAATAYHYELALDWALKNNNEAQAIELAEGLLERYPRSFMALRVLQVLPTVPADRKQEAYEMLRTMDPYNPSIQPSR
jgi:O-antigen ligase